MKKYVSCVIGAMACAASVEIRAQAPAQSQPAPANARPYVIIGCVSRDTPGAARGGAAAPPQFLITDSRGDKPVVYRLDGDVSELTFHVGHMVETTGPLTAPPASRTGPNANAMVMKVSALAYLSPTCKTSK